jgi:3-oxoacyl-[acyl-carrier-protein] synthase II
LGVSARRVFVTGIGLTSPLGNDLATTTAALRAGRHGISTMPEWSKVDGLGTRLAGLVKDVAIDDYPRKKSRCMGRVALLATYATEQAVADARLGEAQLQSGEVGLAYG